MLWQVKYAKALGLIHRTVTEATENAAIECALRLYEQGYSVIAVGTDAKPRMFGADDISRLFAQREQTEQKPLA
jgi:hypothetical protein